MRRVSGCARRQGRPRQRAEAVIRAVFASAMDALWGGAAHLVKHGGTSRRLIII
jgi:hypothetical protein